jgi:hypothetical protein
LGDGGTVFARKSSFTFLKIAVKTDDPSGKDLYSQLFCVLIMFV